MINKELIAMCDTPKIQDRWEPKVGDRYIVYLNGSEHVIDYYTMKQVEGEDFYRGCRTYIPRIEDVLEMIGSTGILMLPGNPSKAIKHALIIFMSLEHDKKWNGKAWV